MGASFDYTGGVKMSAQKIYDISRAREAFAWRLMITVDANRASNGFVGELGSVLEPFSKGHCPVYLQYTGGQAKARIRLGEDWCVHPTDELIHRLNELAGESNVEVQYKPKSSSGSQFSAQRSPAQNAVRQNANAAAGMQDLSTSAY